MNVVPVVVYQRVESLDDLLVLAEGEKRVLGAPLPDLMTDQSEVSIYFVANNPPFQAHLVVDDGVVVDHAQHEVLRTNQR